MALELTRPISPAEAEAYRAGGHWADTVEVDAATLRAGGDALALIDRAERVTYRELAERTERLAAALHELGVRHGDAVVVVTDNDIPSVVACHAIWGLGGVGVLVHKSSGAGDVRFACGACRPAAVLLAPGATGFAEAAAEAGTGAVFGIRQLEEGAGPAGAPAVPVDPDAPRLVVFTSGTTSTPKGVVHTANTLRASAANYRAMTDLRADERFFVVSPLASMAGVMQVLALAPALGACAVLENAWDEERTLDFLLETQGSFYGGTDNVLARLFTVAQRRAVAIPLRAVAVGGTMLQRDVLDTAEDGFGIVVIRVYGSSEAPSSTGAKPDEARHVRLADDGAPMPGVEVRLSDDGADEVLIRGPHVFRGYLDPRDNDGIFDGDWFRTGDAADLHGGRLRVVGRLKEIASRNGRKVSLAEVEEAFRAATGLSACAAFAEPDDVTGERVVVAVQRAANEPLDVPAALDAMVAAGLAKWKLPEAVVDHPAPFPMTATGKIRRRDLAASAGPPLWCAPRLTGTD